MSTTIEQVHEDVARRFLEGRQIVVIGASPQKGNFGVVIARALQEHGTDVVLVHPDERGIDGMPAYRDIGDVPGDPDGVILVVPAAASLEVVRRCAARGIGRVWFFQGIGSPGALSNAALAEARAAGMEVVAGACPIMFLEPVGWFHRLHRSARRHRGAVVEVCGPK